MQQHNIRQRNEATLEVASAYEERNRVITAQAQETLRGRNQLQLQLKCCCCQVKTFHPNTV